MANILFIRERWADGDPANGPSDGDFAIATLGSSGMGEAHVFYYDTKEFGPMKFDLELDKAVECVAIAVKPDVVMFSHLLSWGDRNVKKETFFKLRSCGMKVIGVWHEGIAPDVVRVADEHADCVDLNLFIDTYDQFLPHTKRPDKCLGLLDPRDPVKFSDNGYARTIPISFIGTLVTRPVRCQGIYSLLASGIPVATVTGNRQLCWLEGDQYADVLRRSMIALNFADAGPYVHYKGRVAEATLCGAMLLEQDNPDTKRVLREFVDYVPFTDTKDLIDKTIYYLNHEQERAAIAKSGQAAAREHLSGKEFWTKLFERLGLSA